MVLYINIRTCQLPSSRCLHSKGSSMSPSLHTHRGLYQHGLCVVPDDVRYLTTVTKLKFFMAAALINFRLSHVCSRTNMLLTFTGVSACLAVFSLTPYLWLLTALVSSANVQSLSSNSYNVKNMICNISLSLSHVVRHQQQTKIG